MPEVFFDEILEKAKSIESKLIPFREIERLETWLWKEEGWKSDLDRELFFLRDALNDEYGARLSERIKSLRESQALKMGRSDMRRSIAKLDYLTDELFKRSYQNYINHYTNFFRTKKKTPNFDSETDINLMSEEGKRKLKILMDAYKNAFDYTLLIKKVSRKARAMLDHFERRAKSADQQYRKPDDVERGRVPYDHSSVIPPSNLRDSEILYHATPFVKEILSQGYKTKDQLGNREMLGGDTSGGISFTADINIAREIARCLREVILIAQGKIKINDIIKMVKADRNHTTSSSKGGMWPLEDFISGAIRNKSRKEFQKQHPELAKKLPSQSELYEISSPKEVFQMYKRYLAYTKRRYDPVFFLSSIESFKGLDVNNVGVLASKVEVSKVIKYLDSMEEYRVPPDGVLKTWRVKG